jgi:hypothetical protein
VDFDVHDGHGVTFELSHWFARHVRIPESDKMVSGTRYEQIYILAVVEAVDALDTNTCETEFSSFVGTFPHLVQLENVCLLLALYVHND